MNEQKSQQQVNYKYTQTELDEQELLEQQLILQAIEESKKMQQQQTKNDDEKKQENTDKTQQSEQKQIDNPSKSINNTDALIAASIAAQSVIPSPDHNKPTQTTTSDELLAIHLQQQEQKELLRRQKRSQIYDGKYAKVTSSSSHPTAIPKSALNFYYTDESILNGGLTEEQYQQKLLTQQKSSSEEQIVGDTGDKVNDGSPSKTEEMEAISKHDAKIWSETHMNRLNEYETGGNLDTNMNIGNQAFNSFRNQLDKKGFINYYNYQLEPKQRKR